MIPYIGCDTAQQLVEGFVDGELPMADQVSLEAHLRWCRTCRARVEDLRLIGSALRAGTGPCDAVETRQLAALQARVLTRVRAEHDVAFGVRLRGLFDDNRLLWPAVGATAALAACLFASLSVMQAATAENPASFAAMIARLERPPVPILPPANPGSDQNPMRLDGRVSFPRGLDGASPLESLSDDEAAFAVAAVVTRQGRIATYDLLQANATGSTVGRSGAQDVSAVLDGVRRSRFTPAEAAGTKVAVNMVWLLVRSTVRGTPRPGRPNRPAPAVDKPDVPVDVAPASVAPADSAPVDVSPTTA